MALLQVNTYSKALSRTTTFHVVLPNDAWPESMEGNPHFGRPAKTLYLLHGFTGSTTDWLTGSLIQELAIQYNLAVVMPSGENSFYLNGRGVGRGYETFTAEELPSYCQKTFGLSEKPEDNFIGGMSMGGFGAIHTALKYPERFGKMFGLSSAMIVNGIIGLKPGCSYGDGDYDYFEQTFGNPEQLAESLNNPEYLVKLRKEKGEAIQPVFMACGSEDFLLRQNHEFRDFLLKEGVDLTYRESPGIHDWKFWNEYLEPAIQWLLDV